MKNGAFRVRYCRSRSFKVTETDANRKVLSSLLRPYKTPGGKHHVIIHPCLLRIQTNNVMRFSATKREGALLLAVHQAQLLRCFE